MSEIAIIYNAEFTERWAKLEWANYKISVIKRIPEKSQKYVGNPVLTILWIEFALKTNKCRKI